VSFRRRRDEWDEFLARHGEELLDCGIPDYILQNRMRFLLFLDHGFDQWDWSKDHHAAFFDSRFLNDDQIARLADVVAIRIDDRYRAPISSRWQRWQ